MIDFNKELLEQGKNNKGARVLLHTCCAPCLLSALDKLREFDVTCLYYNPNISPLLEYEKRLIEVKKVCYIYNLPLITLDYDNQEYLIEVEDYVLQKEIEEKCSICFKLRLNKTALTAKNNGFDYFCTTLTSSPHKNCQLINEIGSEIDKDLSVKYLHSDFKKQDGVLLSINLCKQYDIYRQNYCGCIKNNL